MLRTYLKLALRHFTQRLSFSLINLGGLAMGLAAAFAVLLYVQHELSYENFHAKADRIVRVNLRATIDGSTLFLAMVPNRAAPFLAEKLPEVEEAVRVFPHNFGETASVRVGNDNFVEDELYWADPNFLDVFTLNLTAGAPEGSLDRVNTALLSESRARRFFGDDNPVGKTITIDDRYELEVTGVFADPPGNTHLPYGIIGAFETIPLGQPDRLSWGNASFYTFLLLQPGAAPAAIEAKLPGTLAQGMSEDRQWFSLHLKPLRDIHLYSEGIRDNKGGYGNIDQVWLLIALALVLVLIACVNYMNLATARSQQRAAEVGINKTLGATSFQLAGQFYVETALFALGGILLSLGILYLALPSFNQLADRKLHFADLLNPAFALGLLGIWGLITAVAGSYPALYLSSFSPLNAIRQELGNQFGAGFIRRGLVVFQFCISTVLIVGTLTLYQQLQFIRNKNLGYDPEQVIALRVRGVQPESKVSALEKEIRQLAPVRAAALSQSYPGHPASGRTLSLPEAAEGQSADLTSCRAHPGVFEVLDLPLSAGRPMRLPTEGDTITEVVLNRSAVEFLGWTPKEAVGRRVNADLGHSVIVGVCEDFHFSSLRDQIGFYAFHNRDSEWLPYLLVKVDAANLTSSLEQLQSVFERVAPDVAFEYTFLDDHLATLYRSERSLMRVVSFFAGLAIFIACLGLFALAAFATERRTKEIGVRKVLGASVGHIVGLLSREFLLLVGLGFLFAVPIAWWAVHSWLRDFAYRIELQWWVFALAGVLAVVIAFVTVSLQSVKAALRNPVEALRTE